jgi:DNA mismatch repair protein MutL
MRHPYFHRAVMDAYDQILPPDSIPSYFIFLTTDPDKIDINIHPTKTEVKFEDERAIWQIIHAMVRETLGRYNIVPSIDFDQKNAPEIPVFRQDDDFSPPSIDINPGFNPFGKESTSPDDFRKRSVEHWEKMYEGIGTKGSKEEVDLFPGKGAEDASYFQLKGRYIMTPVKSGLMVVDQKRAHQRILFEKQLHAMGEKKIDSQKVLYPVSINLDPADHSALMEMANDLESLGVMIDDLGNHSVVVNGIPGILADTEPGVMLEKLLEEYKRSEQDPSTGIREKIAASLAVSASIQYGKSMSGQEMRMLIDELFACSTPNYTPEGKSIFTIIGMDHLEKLIP